MGDYAMFNDRFSEASNKRRLLKMVDIDCCELHGKICNFGLDDPCPHVKKGTVCCYYCKNKEGCDAYCMELEEAGI